VPLFQWFVTSCCAVLLSASILSAQDGPALYKKSCAVCHDAGVGRAPSRETLHAMTPRQVLAAMESGAMISMAASLTEAERRAIAEFVTEKSLGQDSEMAPSKQAMCGAASGDFRDPMAEPHWLGWGNDLANTRFQDVPASGLAPGQVPRLKLKWAFGFPGDVSLNSQPSIAGGRVYVGSQGAKVYSLSAATGCIHWWFATAAPVRSAVSVGRIETESGPRFAAFFGDSIAVVYAVDASTGALLWKTKVEDHLAARITGSPAFYHGRLYVPVASIEEGSAIQAKYECCSFRGSVVALDGATGKQIWKSYTIAEPARPTKNNKSGTQLWGPSGAPIWTAPTIDTKRNVLYVTTGDNYSDPPTATSDAFLAMDLDTGKIVWSRQTTSNDAYTVACRLPDTTNCPDSNGPDFDFGSSPILVTLPNGRRALIAGQKSGIVHAIDPDRNGQILWQTRIGKGGIHGGIQWGSAADQSSVYVALSDAGIITIPSTVGTEANPQAGGGMFALSLGKGERIWSSPPPVCGERKRCSPAQSAAVSAIPGVAFSGSVDGHLRAYSAKDGTIIWDYDTAREFTTVNGVSGRGGSMDGPGPAIGGGMIFVNSGYAIWGGMPGNVLLAFSVDGR
jgi:polyvinyl alcohol dehydrogenase (cytochrome)